MQTAQTSARTFEHTSLLASATDAELVERAANGDESAFERIMRKNNRLLFRTARSILKSDAEAEDALQEAYLRAWRALSTFRADSKLRPGWCASSSTKRSGGYAVAKARKSFLWSPSWNRSIGGHRNPGGGRPESRARSPSDAISGTSADGSADRPPSRSVPNRIHAARGGGIKRRRSRHRT